MLTDIWTVCLKEWQEILSQRGNKWKTLLNELLILAVLAVFLPSPLEINGEDTSASFYLWYIVPFILLIAKVPDSFAGERERHTLSTLLATRLSDRTIVLSKILATAGYGWAATLITSLFSLIKSNLIALKDTPTFYSLDLFFSGLGISLLTAILIATLGVLVSFGARTVKQAQQSLVLFSLVISLIPMLFIIVTSFLLPDAVNENLASILRTASSNLLVLNTMFVFAIFDLLLIIFTLKRFQRNQLILD